MSAFSDQLAADLDAFVDPNAFGETILYTPSGGVQKSINVLWDADIVVVGANGELIQSNDIAIMVKSSDVPNPVRGDVYVRNGVTYRHRELKRHDDQHGLTTIFVGL